MQLNSRFKRTIKWNKYTPQMTIQNNSNNFNYLIDPTFTSVNRLFILSFKRTEENNVKKVKKITEILFHITMYRTLK